MTWNELAERIIARMSPTQRETDVTVYIRDEDEVYRVESWGTVKTDDELKELDDPCGGVLDDGHPFLVI